MKRLSANRFFLLVVFSVGSTVFVFSESKQEKVDVYISRISKLCDKKVVTEEDLNVFLRDKDGKLIIPGAAPRDGRYLREKACRIKEIIEGKRYVFTAIQGTAVFGDEDLGGMILKDVSGEWKVVEIREEPIKDILRCMSRMRFTAHYIEMYLVDNSGISATIEEIKKEYPENVFLQDSWGQALKFEISDLSVTIKSAGPDGLNGTGDEIVFSRGRFSRLLE